jgi:cytochrome b561
MGVCDGRGKTVIGRVQQQAKPVQLYPRTTVALHWVLVLLVFTLYGIGWYMVGIPKGTAPVAFFYNLHKSLGIIAALPIALLMWWRATHMPPPLPSWLPAWQVRAAHIDHALFYTCLVVLVVSGFIESNFTKFGIKFFGYPLPVLGWQDSTLYGIFNRIHVYTSYFFAALIAVHVAAALKHLLFDHDRVFQRMWFARSDAGRGAVDL